MPRSARYRRLHRLHGDVLIVTGITVAGWFLWPSPPEPESMWRSRPAPVAYGTIHPHALGSILYPGHFAFSSSIGFGLLSDGVRMSTPRWSVAGVKPYLEPLGPQELSSRFPPQQEAGTTRGTPWSRPPSLAAGGTPLPGGTRRAPGGIRPALAEIRLSEELQERSLDAPLLHEALANASTPLGEVHVHVSISAFGRVSGVLFLENVLHWDILRPIEQALLRGVASAAETPSSGWVWIRWQAPSAPGEPGPPSP